MRRKSVALSLAGMILMCASATAYASELERFQPFTDVDLSVFDDAGWTCSVDEWEFTAEVDPVKAITEVEGSLYSDTYTITMDLKIVYSSGKCQIVPRFIFTRSGMMTYYDDRMTDVYIRTGENRYSVDTKGCSRSTNSKDSTATDTSVEVMYDTGIAILEDLAYSEYPIQVKIGEFSNSLELTDSDREAIKEFYETCKEAGVFEQPYLSIFEDDYKAITLFNDNSPDLKEFVMDETEPDEGETEDADELADKIG